MAAGAVLLDHDLIALLRAVDSVVPGNINLFLRLPAHALQNLRFMAELCEQRCHGVCVFLDQEAVSAVRDILCGTAAAHQHACQLTGRRFAHDKAVRIERRREQEQIAPAVPRADDAAVILGRGKEHAVRKPKLVCVGDDLVLIPAAADEDHAERVPRVLELFERVQRDAQALVPRHAAHEQENRHALRQIKVPADRAHVLLRYAAACEVDAVRHHAPVALIAERAQVLPRPMADRPDLVEGADVVDEQLFCALLQKLCVDGVGNVNVKLGVVRKDRRDVDAGAQLAREDGGGDRAVAVDKIERVFHKRLHGLLREREARVIADELRHVDAGIAHDRE